MASNGRLSISGRSSLLPDRLSGVEAPNLIAVCGVVAGVVGAAACALLPLPLLALLAAVCLCLLLMPQTPLVMLVVLLTLSPLRALIATEASHVLPLDIGQLLLAMYLYVCIARGVLMRRRLPGWRPEPVLLAALALGGVFAIGLWRVDDIGNWLTEWLKWAVIAFMIWQLSLSETRNWRWLAFAVLASAVGNALVGLYIFFGGSGADHLLILGRFFRAFGTFGQPNPFGGFMGIALPLAASLAAAHLHALLIDLRARRKIAPSRMWQLIGAGTALTVIAAALVASWSRGAWLGFALSLIAMLIALPRRLFRGLAYAFALSALFGAMWAGGLLPSSVVNRLTTAAADLFTISDARGIDYTAANYAVVERLAHWQAAVSMAQAHPYLGVGLGSYADAYDTFRLLNWEEPLGHAHNLYLNLLAETGVLGLAAYLAFWGVIFRVTWRARRHPDRFARALALGLLGSWTYIAVHSIFDNLYVNNLFLHIGVLLALLAIIHQHVSASLEVE